MRMRKSCLKDGDSGERTRKRVKFAVDVADKEEEHSYGDSKQQQQQQQQESVVRTWSNRERAVRGSVEETHLLFQNDYSRHSMSVLSDHMLDFSKRTRLHDYRNVMADHQPRKEQSSSLGTRKRKKSATTSQSRLKRARMSDCPTSAIIPALRSDEDESKSSVQLDRSVAGSSSDFHPQWSLYKVISGHTSWVQCVAFDPSNEWFVTGAGDRTIKCWEFPTGKLKLTLTGHISSVRGLVVSPRHPYLFSCGEDKKVLCWDLEQNKVVRHYHGHLSGVYCMSLHPTLDVLFTGGRDSTARVWDVRTKKQVMVLSGHKHTVHSVLSQAGEPQVITGSHDRTVRCWDLKKGATRAVLTHHKKAIRALVSHPREYTFASGAADNIKVWKCPDSDFLRNLNERPGGIVECMAINSEGVLVSGLQNGQLKFWDWKSGSCFQTADQPPQSGSLDCEAGIAACSFDVSGSRLVTCEYDKSIKIWKETSPK